MYYNECPRCGAHLDPSEQCDCRDERERRLKKRKADEIRTSEMMEDERWIQEELKNYC